MIPNPAVLTVVVTEVDDVTDGTHDVEHGPFFLTNPRFSENRLVWDDDGDLESRDIVGDVTDNGDSQSVTSATGAVYWLRPVDTYDAVTLAPSAGVPQPIAAIKAALLSGGQLAQELDAVVAADNTVATLMLETSAGTYVRFSGDWQLLSANSESLEDMALVPVGPSAVDIWDAGENTRSTVNISDLPVVTTRAGEVYVQEPSRSDEDRARLNPDAPMIASGSFIPRVDTVDDLPLAIRFASMHPDSQWFVARRAHALEASAMIPDAWRTGVVRPFSNPALA